MEIARGGYDAGYAACPMYWPDRPGSLLMQLESADRLTNGAALDLGCGEGTNAAFLEDHGYSVEGVEISTLALHNARAKYPDREIQWILCDAAEYRPARPAYDLVVAYGLLHCLAPEAISTVIRTMRRHTSVGGHAVLVSFNDRDQDLSGHPDFRPTLLPHQWYEAHFNDWQLFHVSDTDLYETHPDNNIPHHHSMTRIIARRVE